MVWVLGVLAAVAGSGIGLVGAGATSPGGDGVLVEGFSYSPTGSPTASLPLPPGGLLRVPTDGSERVRRLAAPANVGDPVAFTPDGRRLLVIVDPSHYEYIDLAGRALGKISLPFAIRGFSPTGEALVGIGRPGGSPQLSTVYVARADGSQVRALAVFKNALLSVSWSSRGEIAVSAVPYVNGYPKTGLIEVIKARGRVLRLYKPPATGCAWTKPDYLDWSPDGRMLVFDAAARGCPAGVFVLNTNTGRARRVPLMLPWRHPPNIGPRYLTSGQPVFSPDGSSLLIYDGGPGLFRVRTDGSHPVRLADDSSVPPPRPGYGRVLGGFAWQPVPRRK
ncbi:MAG: TolB family protein [Solirubrobacteraceae bacterium]